MASYSKVSALFWKDPRVRSWIAAGEESTVMLALYLKTTDHGNSEGLYWMPEAYVSADLGWEADAVGERMAQLLSADYIDYDDDAQVVFVRDALEHHTPKAPTQIKGAINALERVPRTRLLASLLTVAETHAEDLAKAIRKHFPDRLANSHRKS